MSALKSAILHVSDLHIVDENLSDAQISHFQDDDTFLDVWIKSISDNLIKEKATLKSIVITGDISDGATPAEYKIAEGIIAQLSEKLNVPFDKIMIIPGNHDINWTDLKYYVQNNNIKGDNISSCSIKYDQFKNFYSNMFPDNAFDPNKSVVNVIDLPDLNIVILGINSIMKESYRKKDHYGYVDIEKLKNELSEIYINHNKKFFIIAIHHTPISVGDELRTLKNWTDLEVYFRQNNVHTFLFGHAHTSESKSIRTQETSYYVLCGSIGKVDLEIRNSYNLLFESNKEGKNILKIKSFKYEKGNGNTSYWQVQTDDPNIIAEIPIEVKKSGEDIKELLSTELPKNQENTFETPFDTYSMSLDNNEYSESDFVEKLNNFLYEAIRKNGLFTSGHYHWSKTNRAHGHIDTNYLLGNYQYFSKIKDGFLQLYKSKKIESDLLIGYSMQGNVIGSILATAINCKYTYIPNLIREHSDYEKCLVDVDIQKITIIFDVVFSGESLKNIYEYLTNTYKNITDINVLTIFYTNDIEYSESLFSYKNSKDFFVAENIHFFSLCNMKISGCPYKNIHQCAIYKNKLENINIFYSEGEE